MSWDRSIRNEEELHRPKNEWQAKRQAAWHSADQFKYRHMNREGYHKRQGLDVDFDSGEGEEVNEDDSD